MTNHATQLSGASVAFDQSVAERKARVDLAAFYRICHMFGWTELIYNHITARVDGPERHFLINQFGLMYSEMTASNLVKIDVNGRVVDGSNARVNAPGFTIHSAIHIARKDAHFIVHTHTTEGVTVACSQDGLSPHNFYGAQLHGQVAYHDFEGISIDLGERERLVSSLGDKSYMILRHHGLLTCGETAAAAFFRMYQLQRACEVQVNTMKMGAELRPLAENILAKTARQAQSSVAKGFDKASGFGEDTYAALVRQLDAAGHNFRD
ncbi:class II aldolase/adducin family protein [Bradyrhizobium australafricanum]|uniref:class II aldolase/adducin family protein n=1 Tax=Bradyrhizobium australafricanum TaxID=2821406 RepID=UPI001CE2C1FC|nr:class II aldolase/adducin family protein [Bradyrhizobium australafricanum]MCA6100495.1 class II aldolase/adducin family protein [Bradyrhizobium australafricanum]